MSADLIIGDVFAALESLPADSVDLVFSSPPFLALRSYLPPGHENKALEIGSESTPAAFIDRLLDVVEACDRVLAPHGSLCFELGDTYSGSGGAGGDYGPVGLRSGQPAFDGSAARTRSNRPGQYGTLTGPQRRDISVPGWPLEKSLCGIPTLFAWSLAYGRNLLRPERETERWRIRNVVIWHRPNPPVGALSDKVRPACSFITVATKSSSRWFDLTAIRQPGSPNTHARTAAGVDKRPTTGEAAAAERGGGWSTLDTIHETTGAPPHDWLEVDEDDYSDQFGDEGWTIATQPYRGSHYAVFPEALVVPFVASMCPEKVCTVCGEPRRRIVEGERTERGRRDVPSNVNVPGREGYAVSGSTSYSTLGWTDCGHSSWRAGDSSWRAGVTLDPFAGSGTTLQVATRAGRDAVGIDLDERNEELIQVRVGMFIGDVRRLHESGAA